MKAFPRSFLGVFCIFILAAHPAQAAGKAKGKKGSPPAAGKNADQPAEALSPYINELDQLLALNRDVGAKRKAVLDQAPGRLLTLRAKFATQRDAAPDAERGKFDAAIATCDAITQALNERTEALGKLEASSAVTGSGKLEQGPRKDNLTQGIKGGSGAKAVGSVVELKRERASNRKAAERAAQTDDALTAMTANRWTKRSLELRTQIAAAYARIK